MNTPTLSSLSCRSGFSRERLASNLRIACLTALALALSACGYHLKGTATASALPANLRTAAIEANATLRNALVISLQARGLTVQRGTADADLVIRAREPGLERRLLVADDIDGDAREYELLLTVDFTVDRAGNTRLIEDGRTEVRRELVQDTSTLIGKQTEQDIQRDEMTREVAESIVRQIAARVAGG